MYIHIYVYIYIYIHMYIYIYICIYRTFHEVAGRNSRQVPLRLSYYGGGHYDSIIDEKHKDQLLQSAPGNLKYMYVFMYVYGYIYVSMHVRESYWREL
jgi:hypothetical protein